MAIADALIKAGADWDIEDDEKRKPVDVIYRESQDVITTFERLVAEEKERRQSGGSTSTGSVSQSSSSTKDEENAETKAVEVKGTSELRCTERLLIILCQFLLNVCLVRKSSANGVLYAQLLLLFV